MPIPVWEAERIEGCQERSRTRPLLVSTFFRGAGHEPAEHRVMLVKALGLPELTETGLFAEFFGTQLALAFGLDAPAPALVNIRSELLEAAARNLREWGITPKPGQAVGVEFLRGLGPVNRILPVKGGAELADALQIYAFDMLVQNPDRRGDNPNCGNLRGRLVAYDHEMAFSFLYPIVGGSEPWELPSFARRHIFQPSLAAAARNGSIDWEPVRRAIVAFGERVNELAQFVPYPWRPHAERVATHVQAVVGRAATFEDQLRRSLL